MKAKEVKERRSGKFGFIWDKNIKKGISLNLIPSLSLVYSYLPIGAWWDQDTYDLTLKLCFLNFQITVYYRYDIYPSGIVYVNNDEE